MVSKEGISEIPGVYFQGKLVEITHLTYYPVRSTKQVPAVFFLSFRGIIIQSKQHPPLFLEPRKKIRSVESWLFNRNPGIIVYFNNQRITGSNDAL